MPPGIPPLVPTEALGVLLEIREQQKTITNLLTRITEATERTAMSAQRTEPVVMGMKSGVTLIAVIVFLWSLLSVLGGFLVFVNSLTARH